jgi:hypothetical protein
MNLIGTLPSGSFVFSFVTAVVDFDMFGERSSCVGSPWDHRTRPELCAYRLSLASRFFFLFVLGSAVEAKFRNPWVERVRLGPSSSRSCKGMTPCA